MANNCVSNFRIICDKKEVLDGLCEKFNSLREKYPDDPNYFWGQTSLKHLSEVLGVKADEIRGYIDPDPDAYACLVMSGRDVSPEAFEVTASWGVYQLRFSVLSGWNTPLWFTDYLDALARENEEYGFAYGFRATDEFGNFHSAYRGDIIGGVYEIDHCDGGTYDYGEEEEFLRKISVLTGIPITENLIEKAQNGQFEQILEAVDEYNAEHEGDEVYVHIFEENYCNV